MEAQRSNHRGPTGVLLLTLYLDLVGFSIFFPLYAEMMEWYTQAGSPLLARWAQGMESLFGVSDPARLATFFGATLGGLYAFGQFLVTPAWGRLSDRVGRRPVLLATISLNLLGYVIWIFSADFAWLLLSRFIGSMASANIGVASAAVADLSTPERRTRAMGMMGAVIGLGFITGPAIGSLHAIWPALGDQQSGLGLHPFSVPALVATGLTVFNLWWLYRRFHELARAPRDRVAAMAGRSINPIHIFSSDAGPLVGRMCLAYFLFTVVFSGFESTFVFIAWQFFDWGPGRVGPFMAAVGLVSAGIQGGLIRRLSGRVPERTLGIIGLTALVPGLIGFALVPGVREVWTFLVGGLLIGAGVGFFTPAAASMASLSAQEGAQGMVMGRYRSAGALGRAIGPLIAGLLYFRFGPASPYVVGACLLLLPLWLLVRGPGSSGSRLAED